MRRELHLVAQRVDPVEMERQMELAHERTMAGFRDNDEAAILAGYRRSLELKAQREMESAAARGVYLHVSVVDRLPGAGVGFAACCVLMVAMLVLLPLGILPGWVTFFGIIAVSVIGQLLIGRW